MTTVGKRSWFQFRLRTLFVVVLIASVGLWLWTKPFAVEDDWGGYYGWTTNYQLRRGWNGRRYFVGPATLTYQNGQLAARGNVNGIEEETLTFWIGDEHFEYWREDGQKLNWEDWFLYVSTDYLH
jgi:hypothetical protein